MQTMKECAYDQIELIGHCAQDRNKSEVRTSTAFEYRGTNNTKPRTLKGGA